MEALSGVMLCVVSLYALRHSQSGKVMTESRGMVNGRGARESHHSRALYHPRLRTPFRFSDIKENMNGEISIGNVFKLNKH